MPTRGEGTAAFERRTLLKLAAGAGAAVAAGGPGLFAPRAAAASGRSPDIFVPDHGFTVDISGLPALSANVREIAIEELTVDVREMTTGLDVEYRLYGPGATHWGPVKLLVASTAEGSAELQNWVAEVRRGKNIRKNITVSLFKSDKSPGRSYSLVGSFPTKWTRVRFDEESDVAMETLTIAVERIELDAADDEDDEPREDTG